MVDLASLGLKVRTCVPSHPGERRLELRLSTSSAFVAWFQVNDRASVGDQAVSTNAQLVSRGELSDEQLAGAREWLREQMLAAI